MKVSYLERALETENVDYEMIGQRASSVPALRLLHAALGLADESGEIAKAVKAHVFYGKPIDEINLQEEVGDVLWFLSLILDQIGSSFDGAAAANLRKLRQRYSNGRFGAREAIERDPDAERAALSASERRESGDWIRPGTGVAFRAKLHGREGTFSGHVISLIEHGEKSQPIVSWQSCTLSAPQKTETLLPYEHPEGAEPYHSLLPRDQWLISPGAKVVVSDGCGRICPGEGARLIEVYGSRGGGEFASIALDNGELAIVPLDSLTEIID